MKKLLISGIIGMMSMAAFAQFVPDLNFERVQGNICEIYSWGESGGFDTTIEVFKDGAIPTYSDRVVTAYSEILLEKDEYSYDATVMVDPNEQSELLFIISKKERDNFEGLSVFQSGGISKKHLFFWDTEAGVYINCNN